LGLPRSALAVQTNGTLPDTEQWPGTNLSVKQAVAAYLKTAPPTFKAAGKAVTKAPVRPNQKVYATAGKAKSKTPIILGVAAGVGLLYLLGKK